VAIRKLNALAAKTVEKLTKDGWHADGGGLYLRISDNGQRRRWVYRYVRTIEVEVEGKKVRKPKATEVGLGAASAVSLAAVRQQAKKLREQVAAGTNPIEERKRQEREAASRKTFAEVAALVMARQAKSGRGESSLDSWRYSFDEHCANIAKLDVGEITVANVLTVVTPLIDDGYHPSARRTLARIADVLGYAIAHGWRTTANVAAWDNIKAVIPERPNGKDHRHPMLPWLEAPAFIRGLRQTETMGSRCLEFIVLTAVRLTEARGAQWKEFDFKTATWIAPASRMKRGVEFKVPLSDRAVTLLEKLKAHRRVGTAVFPVSREVVWRVCKRLAPDASVHGLRATFKSWCQDSGIDEEVAEGCLSHGPGDATKAAYNRGEMVERRRKVMQAWTDFLDGKDAANVVPLRRA
jgi:integrase